MSHVAPTVKAPKIPWQEYFGDDGRLVYAIIWCSSGVLGGFVFLKWRGYELIADLLSRRKISFKEHEWLRQTISQSDLLEE